jgi:hypothetical protein
MWFVSWQKLNNPFCKYNETNIKNQKKDNKVNFMFVWKSKVKVSETLIFNLKNSLNLNILLYKY